MAGRLVFCAAFALYGVTASPAVGWLDSPEFIATSAELGVAHSPGHPLPALLGHLAGYLPVGDLIFRVHAVSCLLSALAVWALWAAGRTLLARVAPDLGTRARDLASAAAALAFGLSWAVWYQAVRAEVYALQTLLVVGVLAALIAYDRERRPRWLLVAGLLGGLALSNHHFIALTALVPGAVFVLARRGARPPAAVASACATLGVIGLAAFLYLPVRAHAGPATNWGAPDTADRFAWTVSAQAFHKAIGGERPTTASEDSGSIALALADDAGVPLVALALVGLYAGLRRRRWRAIAGLLAATVVTTAGARALIGFSTALPDHHAYLTPAVAALILLGLAGAGEIAAGVAAARPRLASAATAAAIGLVVIAVPVQFGLHAGDSDLRGADASDRVAEAELEDLAPRAILLPTYFETSFRVAALRAVAGARPDITVLDLGFLTYPGMAEDAIRRDPELAPVIEAPLRLGAPLPVMLLGATGRPIAVQLSPELDDAALRRVTPSGPFAYLTGAPLAPEERGGLERADVLWRARLGAELSRRIDPTTTDGHGALDHLLWHDFNRLRFYCRIARPIRWRPPTASELGDDCALTRLPGEAPPPPARGRGAKAGAR